MRTKFKKAVAALLFVIVAGGLGGLVFAQDEDILFFLPHILSPAPAVDQGVVFDRAEFDQVTFE